ncbi:hypothetical protein [Streptomyces broussonetiae]|uniref:hypothetical protein n=1 Tax=Streptomyces broussonetiae TaxID=2686304 RepID=UPI0035E12499
MRGARQDRPTPAAAVPGIGAGDRSVVEAHDGILPTPRAGTVRGTMGKPQLPRRRAQEHIVPQLRGGPAPRQDADTVAGHDPGLMAAFQRGIGLAEAQQHMQHMEHVERMAAVPMEPVPMESAFMVPVSMDPAPTEPGSLESASMNGPDLLEPVEPAPIPQGRAHTPGFDGAGGAGRPDGSAPAG